MEKQLNPVDALKKENDALKKKIEKVESKIDALQSKKVATVVGKANTLFKAKLKKAGVR